MIKMATSTYKVLCLLVALTLLNPETIAAVKNTIFADEKIEGGAFQYLDAFRSANVSNTGYRDYRLPITTRPIHYDVLWKIDVENKSFSGRVDIKLVATQANVNEVVIHSASYLTRASTVLTLDATDIPITVETQPEFDFLRIRLNSGSLQYDAATEVIYTLSISFTAPLRTDMHGLFIHLYQDDGSIARSMVASHFKTSYARSALPCYDEPRFKATFDVVISRPSDFSSWFSSRVYESRPGDAGYVEDIYRRTPPMSIYLLALVVGNFRTVFNFHPDNTLRHELIYPFSTQNDVLTAFQLGHEAIDKMGEHTGINYYTVDENMKKMTHGVIPYFAAGTSENWGLIMSREAYAVYDGTHTGDYYRQLMSSLIGKQIAHMWFGSVVTNEFWDCLWLNEGFGRYYQYFLTHWVDRGFSSMGLDMRFIPEQVHTGLLSDSAPGAPPLTNPAVGSPASVAAMFSPITLNKGAAVIRMTEHLLGFEIHRQGLQSYLRNRYLDTAVPNDLFEALQTVAVSSGAISAYGSDFSVVDYYRSWTEKGGHPVLFVRVDHQTGDMVVQQRRFDINTGYSSDGSEWIVPVSFATASNPDFANTKPSHIIREAVTIIDRGTVGDEWVIFNKQQTGFYRVNYDEYTWDLIVLALRGEDRTKIHEYNRAQIVDDVFQFARSGVMNYTRAFNILSFLEHETEYAPWAAAITGFTWLRSRLAGTPDLASLDQMIIRWATPIMSELTYSAVRDESFMRAYLRRQLAPLMCAAGVRECRDVAEYQFWYMAAGGQVSPNSRHWVYCNGLREGSESDFDALWQRYQNAGPRLDVERLQILESIGCTPHASRINLLLTNIVEDNDLILKQEYALALNSILDGNDGNALVVFAYIRDNLSAIIDAFGSAAVLSDVAARLRTTEHIAEFENWATANRNALGDAYISIMESAELSRQSLAWVATVRDDISDYLVNGDQDISTTTTAPPSATTVSRPDLEDPDTPNIPASAVTAFVSFSAVVFATFAFAL